MVAKHSIADQLAGFVVDRAIRRSAPWVDQQFNRGLDAVGHYIRNPTNPFKRRRSSSSATPTPSANSMPGRGFRGRRRRFGRRRFRGRRFGRRHGPSSRMNTQYHETQGRFRASNRGRRRHRQGVSVLRGLLSLDPVQTYTNSYSVNGTTAANQIAVYGNGLYTTQMTGDTDLSSIFTDAGYGIGTATNLTAKLFIKSAIMDIQVTNTGSAPIILDIYEMYQRRDVATTNNIGSQWSTFFNYQTAITAENAYDIAVTPFENPVFLEYYKILNKQETLMGAGEVITRQMKLTRPRIVEGSVVGRYSGAYPRANRFWLFVWQGIPNATAGSMSTAGVSSTTLTFSVQKVYHWQYVPSMQELARQHNAGD